MNKYTPDSVRNLIKSYGLDTGIYDYASGQLSESFNYRLPTEALSQNDFACGLLASLMTEGLRTLGVDTAITESHVYGGLAHYFTAIPQQSRWGKGGNDIVVCATYKQFLPDAVRERVPDIMIGTRREAIRFLAHSAFEGVSNLFDRSTIKPVPGSDLIDHTDHVALRVDPTGLLAGLADADQVTAPGGLQAHA